MTEKQNYEQQISQSPVFSLEKGTTAYVTAAIDLVSLLFEYLIKQDREWQKDEDKNRSYGEEILNTAVGCIKNYDPEKGPFLHYFKHSWKKKFMEASGKEKLSISYGGIHFTGDQRKMLWLYDTWAKKAAKDGIDTSTDEFLELLKQNLGWSQEQCKNVRELASCRTVSENQITSDGECVSIYDTISASDRVESGIEQQSVVEECFARIGDMYANLQERQKPLARSIITKIVLEAIGDYIILERIPLGQYSFCDGDVLTKYIKTWALPMQKELATDLGVAESQISRTLNSLLAKLRSALTTLD